MNEMYVITVLMLYTLLILSETLLNTYCFLIYENNVVEDKFIFPKQSFINLIHIKITPLILEVNLKKDYRLNMKRRPPIILVAH